MSQSIFEYGNYREYLKDYYAYSKLKNKNFSFRVFARLAGFNSPATLKRVMEGERNLSVESIQKFAKALKLNKEETLYFRSLVLMNQAAHSDEKLRYAKEIASLGKFRKLQPLKNLQLKFYSKWYLTIVREMVCLPDFQEDPEWIARKLHPSITKKEAASAVEELLELELIKRNGEGKLVQTDNHVSTGDEVTSAFLIQYHKEILKRAAESIDSVTREKRDISSMAIGVSKDVALKLKEMIQKFRREIVEVCSQGDRVEVVYLFNMQLFPALAEVIESNGTTKAKE
jgi:uncharacterized protein (TIGR02147 family)